MTKDKRTAKLASIKDGDPVVIRMREKFHECTCVRITPTGQMTVLFNARKIRFNHRGHNIGKTYRWSSVVLLGAKEDFKEHLEMQQQAQQLDNKRAEIRAEIKGFGVYLNQITNTENAQRVLELIKEIKTICKESQP